MLAEIFMVRLEGAARFQQETALLSSSPFVPRHPERPGGARVENGSGNPNRFKRVSGCSSAISAGVSLLATSSTLHSRSNETAAMTVSDTPKMRRRARQRCRGGCRRAPCDRSP